MTHEGCGMRLGIYQVPVVPVIPMVPVVLVIPVVPGVPVVPATILNRYHRNHRNHRKHRNHSNHRNLMDKVSNSQIILGKNFLFLGLVLDQKLLGANVGGKLKEPNCE